MWFYDVNMSGPGIKSIITSDNSIISVGLFTDSLKLQSHTLVSLAETDFYMVKYDANGNIIWLKSYEGNGHEDVHDIEIDESDNFYVTLGLDEASLNIDGQLIDSDNGCSVLLKFDNTGQLMWYKQGGSGDIYRNYFGKMKIDKKGNILLLGEYRWEPEYFGNTFRRPSYWRWVDVGEFLIKLDSNGEFLWYIDGSTDDKRFGIGDVAIDTENNIIISGSLLSYYTFGEITVDKRDGGDKYLIKIDENGKIIWFRTSGNIQGSYGHMDYLTIDEEGNYYVAGEFEDNLSFFGSVIKEKTDLKHGFLAKLDTSCNLIWIKHFESAWLDIRDLNWTRDHENLLLTGIYHNKLDAADLKLAHTGYQTYVLKLDKQGVIKNAFSSSGKNSAGLSIVEDYSGDLVLSGRYLDTMFWECQSTYSRDMAPYILKFRDNEEVFDLSIRSNASDCISNDSTFSLNINNYPRFRNYQWNYSDDFNLVSESYTSTQYHINLKYRSLQPGLINVDLEDTCGVTYQSSDFLSRVQFPPQRPELLDLPDSICLPTSISGEISSDSNIDKYIWHSLAGGADVEIDTTEINQNNIYFDENFNTGEIIVRAQNSCGVSEPDTSKIIIGQRTPNIPKGILGESQLCIDTEYLFEIDEYDPELKYTWDLTANSSAISPYQLKTSYTEPGVTDIVKLQAFNRCGISAYQEKSIQTLAPPQNLEIDADSCQQTLSVNQGEHISWYYLNELINNANSRTLAVQDTGIYYVENSNICGITQSDPIQVFPANFENVFIPNVITPNSDGINDNFIIGKSLLDSYLGIYNRFGKMVFEHNSYNNSFSGQNLPSGIYYYYIRNRCFSDDFKGSLSIIK